MQDLRTEKSERTHTYHSENAATVEDLITRTVPGKISRENVWLDGASIVAQLTAP
ncbi:hypothetical protein [Streptomyces hokutonensis]|uniref:hypothetical protein n=1 Tax=Streptomyces hokutonensis TaxID=1306990 RepID=UPI0033E4E3E0